MVAFAAGSGITPLLSIVTTADRRAVPAADQRLHVAVRPPFVHDERRARPGDDALDVALELARAALVERLQLDRPESKWALYELIPHANSWVDVFPITIAPASVNWSP